MRRSIVLPLLLLAASLLCTLVLSRPAQALDALPEKITEPQFGDLDDMASRRSIRALVYWSKTDYFIVKGQPRGIAWETGRDLEKYINTRLRRGKRPIAVVMIPVARDQVISYLEQGRGDIAIAGLRLLPERHNIDFSTPVHDDVSEIVVRNKDAAPVSR